MQLCSESMYRSWCTWRKLNAYPRKSLLKKVNARRFEFSIWVWSWPGTVSPTIYHFFQLHGGAERNQRANFWKHMPSSLFAARFWFCLCICSIPKCWTVFCGSDFWACAAVIGLKPVGIETAGKAIKHFLPCLDLEDPLRDRLPMNWRLVCLCAVKEFCVTCVPEVGDGGLSWKRQNSGHQLRWGDIFFCFQQSPFPQLVAPPVTWRPVGLVLRRWMLGLLWGAGKKHALQGVTQSKHYTKCSSFRGMTCHYSWYIHGVRFCFWPCFPAGGDRVWLGEFPHGVAPVRLRREVCWVGSPPPTLEDWEEEGPQLMMFKVAVWKSCRLSR